MCIGVPHSGETAPPHDRTVGLCLGPNGGFKGGCCFLLAKYLCSVLCVGCKVDLGVVIAHRPPPYDPPRTLGITLG
jgi:hypothetical protein